MVRRVCPSSSSCSSRATTCSPGRAHRPDRLGRHGEGLPEGFDGALESAFPVRRAEHALRDGGENLARAPEPAAERPDARADEVDRGARGASARCSRRSGRWKERCPLAPIERYVAWTREDGLPFDPWLRVHARIGGEILAPEPKSLRITGTAAEWEGWTGMAFPESGSYVFPHDWRHSRSTARPTPAATGSRTVGATAFRDTRGRGAGALAPDRRRPVLLLSSLRARARRSSGSCGRSDVARSVTRRSAGARRPAAHSPARAWAGHLPAPAGPLRLAVRFPRGYRCLGGRGPRGSGRFRIGLRGRCRHDDGTGCSPPGSPRSATPSKATAPLGPPTHNRRGGRVERGRELSGGVDREARAARRGARPKQGRARRSARRGRDPGPGYLVVEPRVEQAARAAGGSEQGGTEPVTRVLWRLGATSSTFTGFYRIGTSVAADAPRPLPFLASRRTTAHDVGRILFQLHAAMLGRRNALARTRLSRHEARVALGLLLARRPGGRQPRPAPPGAPPRPDGTETGLDDLDSAHRRDRVRTARADDPRRAHLPARARACRGARARGASSA